MKTGRPKKELSTTRDIVKHIRYSPEEWDEVSSKLELYNGSYSSFIRKATMSARVVSPVDRETIMVVREANLNMIRVLNNINSIAKRANTQGRSFTDFDFTETVILVKQLNAELIKLKSDLMKG